MLKFNKKAPSKQQGVTLVELVIAIVIISIAAVALLQGLGLQAVRNVDPMIQSQAQLLARQFLQEVSSKSFFDGAADPRLSPSFSRAQINASVVNQDNAGDPSRIAWDNIYEYAGYNTSSILGSDGTPVSSLSGYGVDIAIDISSSVAINGLSNSAVANCPPRFALITVTITDPRGNKTQLSGYRASYWSSPASWGC